MVERVNEDGSGLVAVHHGRHECLVDRRAGESHVSAVGEGRLHLRDRGAFGHEHGRPYAEKLGGKRHALRMITGTRGNDTPPPLLFREERNPVVGAADLEGPGALEVLGDEMHPAADPVIEPSRTGHGQFANDTRQSRGCSLDVFERHGLWRGQAVGAHEPDPCTGFFPARARCSESRARDAALLPACPDEPPSPLTPPV
ncbi:unannotated protein [freshwater metagenome]|uniref:Unannotated protein n=1 Tax=freshwater metagenome TaxID=449393 RepID=A0A6J6TSB2_9ZZZZ